MHHAQHTVDNVVDSPANDGSRRRAYYQTRGYSMPPLLRLACRAYSEPRATEQSYIDHIQAVCQQAGYSFPRWLITNYYVSLKTNPLVILAGPEGTGKAAYSWPFNLAYRNWRGTFLPLTARTLYITTLCESAP
jgi:hypothetical protein